MCYITICLEINYIVCYVCQCVCVCLLVKAQMAEFVGWDQGEVERVTSRL